MDIFTKADNTKMGDLEWESFLEEAVIATSHARSASYEWADIQKAVKNEDGDATHGTQIYRHYIPYQVLRVALEKIFVEDGKSREMTCRWLYFTVLALYKDCKIFPFEKLKPPHNLFEVHTRMGSSAWTTWALEAICDYPDNIFYGPGMGDGSGTKVDIPTGATKVQQLQRVRAGAVRLRNAFEHRLDTVVDAQGNPI